MIFTTNETCTELVELNTMAELQAFALGGTGKIEINFVNYHPATGNITKPRIRKVNDNE